MIHLPDTSELPCSGTTAAMDLPDSSPAGPRPPAPAGPAAPVRVIDETPIVLDPGEQVVRLEQPPANQASLPTRLAAPAAAAAPAASAGAAAVGVLDPPAPPSQMDPPGPPEPAAAEDSWGASQPGTMRVWPWVLVLVLLGMAGLAVWHWAPRTAAGVVDASDDAGTRAPRPAALEWYRLNPDVAEREARTVLEAYVSATSLDEVLPLVRALARVEPLVRARWKPLGSALRPPAVESQAAFSEVGGTAFFVLSAQLQDFRSLRAYFVREDGVMKLDWEATSAFSSVPASALASSADFHREEVRCLVEARGVALPGYPSDQFNGYLLVFPDSDELFWGLARIGSQADEGLLNALDRGRFLLELKNTERVTLELERARGAAGNYFEITKFNHREWVRP